MKRITGFPLSAKTRNVREFCLSWNVKELSGNFDICQGIFTENGMPMNAVGFHCAVPMGTQDHYDIWG